MVSLISGGGGGQRIDTYKSIIIVCWYLLSHGQS